MTHVLGFAKTFLDIDPEAFIENFCNNKFIYVLDESINLWKSISWRYTYIFIRLGFIKMYVMHFDLLINFQIVLPHLIFFVAYSGLS